MRRPARRGRPRSRPVASVGCLDADDLGTEVDRVVERSPGGRAPGRTAARSLAGVSTTTAMSAAVERRRRGWPRAGRPDATAGLPSTRTTTRSVTSGSCWPAIVSSSWPSTSPGDEPQRQLAQRGQVRLGEELVERDLRSAPADRRCRASSAGAARAGSCRRARSRRRASSTSSGRRSLTGAPVIVATASATLSRCWTFIVLTTWMPASRMTSTSCQRFSRAEPGDVGVGQLVDQGDGRAGAR